MAIKSDKAMQTYNSFSFHRLMLLFKQSLVINKRRFTLGLSAFSGFLFIALFFAQSVHNYTNWGNKDYVSTFVSIFFSLGIAYSAFSFPPFRSKEKSMAYLMLPATNGEKFVYEILSRIVAFIVLMPLLFWTVANLEGTVIHYFFPELTNYKFSFSEGFLSIVKDGKFEFWALILTLQGILFIFIAPFAGASHFSKSPLLKTILTFSVVMLSYFLFTFLIVKSFNLEGLHHQRNSLLFMKDSQMVIELLGIAMVIVNLTLLTIAWFSLKEKEA